MKDHHRISQALIRAYHTSALANGRCLQCLFPWFDGMCFCGQGSEENERIAEIAYTLDPRERYLLECELKGETPLPPCVPQEVVLPTLDRTPAELQGLWEFET